MRIIFLFLFFLLSPQGFLLAQIENKQNIPLLPDNKNLPYFQEIRKILDGLEYSGFRVFQNPQSKIVLDFEKRQWQLLNSREFDSNGKVLLDKDRYGLCADLAIYVFERIHPLLNDQESLKFAMVTHKGFFPTEASNHIVLLLFIKNSKQVYLIDPSFQIYGKAKELSDYEVIDFKDVLSISKNDIYLVDSGVPVFIRKDVLLSFTVSSIDKTFDKDNFFLLISGKPKGLTMLIDLIIVGKHEGQVESFINRELLAKFFTAAEVQAILNKFGVWLKEIEQSQKIS